MTDRLILTIFAGVLGLMPGEVQAGLPPLVWKTENVFNSPSSYSFDISLALDGSGNPHIAFPQASDGSLRYSSRVGETWQTQKVVAGGVDYNLSSLAIDSLSRPQILYRTSTSALQLSKFDGASWSSSVVASAAYGDLAMDSLNRTHVVFGDSPAIRHAVENVPAWNTTVIESGQTHYRNPSIVIGRDSNPHVAYWSYGGTTTAILKYAAWTGSAWTVSTVENTTSAGSGDVSLALDANANPSVVYHATSGLTCATLAGSAWQRQAIPTLGTYSAGLGNNLAFLPSGEPIVAFTDGENSTGNYLLRYGVRQGGIWETQTIALGDSNHPLTGVCMLTDDASVHIAYQASQSNANTSILKYAVAVVPEPTWLTPLILWPMVCRRTPSRKAARRHRGTLLLDCVR